MQQVVGEGGLVPTVRICPLVYCDDNVKLNFFPNFNFININTVPMLVQYCNNREIAAIVTVTVL